MDVTSVILAQTGRFLAIKFAVYIPDAIHQLCERYGFVRRPQTPEELVPSDPARPIVFGHGKFIRDQRTIVVQNVSIYLQAVMVSTSTSTDDSEAFLDDLVEWATTSLGLKVDEVWPRRIYASQLEVALAYPLERLFPMTNRVGEMVARLYGTYGQEVAPLQVHSFGMNIDPTKTNLGFDFRVERRAEVPYDKNIYFSQAPLKTADHITALEEFERVVGEAATSDERAGRGIFG